MIINICEKIISYAFFILVFASPIVYSTHSNNIFRTPKEVFAQILIVIIVTSWLIKITEESYLYNKPFLLLKKVIAFPFAVPVTILILFSIVSIHNSTVYMISIKDIVNLVLYSALYFMIVLNIKSYRQIDVLITSAIAVAVFTAFYCILQYYGYDPLFYPANPSDRGSTLAAGFMDNPNLAAGYMAVLIPLALYKTISPNPLLIKIPFLFSSVLIFAGILATSNRTSLASSVIASLFFIITYFILRPGKLHKGKIAALAILLTVIMSTAAFLAYKKGIVKSILSVPSSINESTNDRIIFWRSAWEMIVEKPLTGIGIGTFKLHYLDYRKKALNKRPYFGQLERADQAHNDYLQLWAETGIFGFLTGMWIIIYYFYTVFRLIKILKREDRISDIVLVLSFTSSIIIILLYAITCFPFHIVPTSVLFVFLVGMTVRLSFNSSNCSLR